MNRQASYFLEFTGSLIRLRAEPLGFRQMLRGRYKEKIISGEESPSNLEILNPRPQIFLDMRNPGIPDFTSHLTT